MARVWFGHFDSTAEDRRKLLAADWATYMRSFITNGVRNLGTNLHVTADAGVTLRARAGILNIEGYILIITPDINGDYVEVQLEDPHPIYGRIDRVVARLDLRPQNRLIGLYTLTGVASANPVPPELTRNAEIYELSLARVHVGGGVVAINPEDVHDERAVTELCGIINSVLGLDSTAWQMEFDRFIARMMQQEEAFLAGHEEQFVEQMAQFVADWTTQTQTQQTDFEAMQAVWGAWIGGAIADPANYFQRNFDNPAMYIGSTRWKTKVDSKTTLEEIRGGQLETGPVAARRRTTTRTTGAEVEYTFFDLLNSSVISQFVEHFDRVSSQQVKNWMEGII